MTAATIANPPSLPESAAPTQYALRKMSSLIDEKEEAYSAERAAPAPLTKASAPEWLGREAFTPGVLRVVAGLQALFRAGGMKVCKWLDDRAHGMQAGSSGRGALHATCGRAFGRHCRASIHPRPRALIATWCSCTPVV